MSEGALDETEVDAGFEQRGGGSMPERMEGHARFGDTGTALGFTEGALEAVSTHGRSGRRAVFVSTPSGREAPGWLAVGCPGGSSPRQGILRQRDVTVLGALASMTMALETLPVNGGA